MAFETRPERILLPVKVGFMAASLLLALAFNLLPWRDLRGVPDLVALVLAFWCVHQPRKMGIGVAWGVGLVMDAANGVLFGQHALAYAALAYAAQALAAGGAGAGAARGEPAPHAGRAAGRRRHLSGPVVLRRQRDRRYAVAGGDLPAARPPAAAGVGRRNQADLGSPIA
jgi:hypothetical protein